jgi:UDP-N-acetyl-D-glucosamine/UDP-N-acetyl-D-galactosamine dehydrogenase
MSHDRKIAVIGLDFVGLPMAAAFARAGSPVIGFDIDAERVRELQAGRGRTREVDASDPKRATLDLTSDKAALERTDFFINTVPTPIDAANRPDLGAMLEASRSSRRPRNCRRRKMTQFLPKLSLVRSVGIAVACKALTP